MMRSRERRGNTGAALYGQHGALRWMKNAAGLCKEDTGAKIASGRAR